MHMSDPLPKDVSISGRITAEFAQIITPEALELVTKLHRSSEPRRQELLARRAARQKAFDAGAKPDFLEETKHVRDSQWKVASQPKDLLDRRGETTAPPARK